MLVPGLVSATLRQRAANLVIHEAQKARLEVIEWTEGSHVPNGNERVAAHVGRSTREAGLQVAAYGSYLYLGSEATLQPWLDTACALGAPRMRIWAGRKGSGELSVSEQHALIDELGDWCDQAYRSSIQLALEFHEGTFTDSPETTRCLLEMTAHPGLECYWQLPRSETSLGDLQYSLDLVRPWLSHLHIFWRKPEPNLWEALKEGARIWRPLLHSLQHDGRDHAVMIEFVRAHSLDALREDARTLLEWLH